MSIWFGESDECGNGDAGEKLTGDIDDDKEEEELEVDIEWWLVYVAGSEGAGEAGDLTEMIGRSTHPFSDSDGVGGRFC